VGCEGLFVRGRDQRSEAVITDDFMESLLILDGKVARDVHGERLHGSRLWALGPSGRVQARDLDDYPPISRDDR
jgi:hypothetical protein